MVNLTTDGICNKCPYPHLYFERFDGEDEELGSTYSYTVDCRHYDACMRAYAMGKEAANNENSGSGSDI